MCIERVPAKDMVQLRICWVAVVQSGDVQDTAVKRLKSGSHSYPSALRLIVAAREDWFRREVKKSQEAGLGAEAAA